MTVVELGILMFEMLQAVIQLSEDAVQPLEEIRPVVAIPIRSRSSRIEIRIL